MKVGEYIRTPFGIRKIVDTEKDECYKPRVKILVLDRHLRTGYRFNYKFYTDEKFIKKSKHSFNILDLIEVGDYVNGYLVIERDINNELRYIYLKDRNMKYVKNLDIKSIVTKEQYEAMKYEI